MVARRELRAEHSPLFHGLSLVIGQICIRDRVLTMNVLLINGSPHKNGCTNAALTEMAKVLNEAGIDVYKRQP